MSRITSYNVCYTKLLRSVFSLACDLLQPHQAGFGLPGVRVAKSPDVGYLLILLLVGTAHQLDFTDFTVPVGRQEGSYNFV